MRNVIMGNTDLLQQLMGNIGDNLFFEECNSKFIIINKANARWFGLKDPQEAVGKDDFDFFEEQYNRRQLEEEQWIMQTGKPIVREATYCNIGRKNLLLPGSYPRRRFLEPLGYVARDDRSACNLHF